METALKQDSMQAQPTAPPAGSWLSKIDWRSMRSVLALALVMIVLAVFTEGTFLTPRNLTNLTRQVALNGILAVGMTFVILIGGIDLSVGSVVALSGVVAGILQVNQGLAQWTDGAAWAGALITLAAAMLTGLLCGIFNATLITRGRIAPFIITLGMMVIARGLALIFSDGAAISPLGDAFNELGQGYISASNSVVLIAVLTLLSAALAWLRAAGASLPARVGGLASRVLLGAGAAYVFGNYQGIPIPVAIFGVLAFAGMVLLDRTRFGRFVLAIGGNPEAAWLAGVPIRPITFSLYAGLGALAGLSGAILSARLNGALPTSGELFELDAIAAVVIGGTSLLGGVGTIRGSVLGAFFIGALNNGMSLMDITEFYQKVIKGVIIILAVWFDQRGMQKGGRK